MKRVTMLICLLLLFLYPNRVQALYYCPYEVGASIKQLAANMTTSYDETIVGDRATFSITFYNFHKDLILYDATNEKYYYPEEDKDMSELTLTGYESGTTYRFDVYSSVEDCKEEVMFVIYVNLPTYNPYYQERICSDIPNYNLCQKWYNHGLTRERFIEEVTKYKESLKKQNQGDPTTDDDHEFPYIIEFYLRYYYIILPIIILGGGYIIYYARKKDTFGF